MIDCFILCPPPHPCRFVPVVVVIVFILVRSVVVVITGLIGGGW